MKKKHEAERNVDRSNFDQLEDALIRTGKAVDFPSTSALRHPDQESEWRGADVLVTSDFSWEPQSFAEAHDLVVRTRHAVELTWLLFQIRDTFCPWLRAQNKCGFYGSLAQAALDHLAAHQPEPDDPRPLLRAVLIRAFEWLQVLREKGAIPDDATCIFHVQDAEGRQQRIDMQTGEETT